MGFSTPPLFAPSEHLIGGRRVHAMFPGECLNRFALMFQPGFGLCSSTDSGHSSKPYKLVQNEMTSSPLGVCHKGYYIQMSGIGSRLRQERERLGLSQKVFGEIGGVEANAQGKYESGGRAPKADYLSRVAEKGVDILFVLTGSPTPVHLDNLSQIEEKVLGNYRAMFKEDQDAIRRLTNTLAEHSSVASGKPRSILKES